MGGTQGIEKVFEKLAQILTAKVSKTKSSGNGIVAYTEPIQKIELMPNDIKLEGVRNYLSWSRRALLILKTKGIESFVEGKTIEPVSKTGAKWRNWSKTTHLWWHGC